LDHESHSLLKACMSGEEDGANSSSFSHGLHGFLS
jgi:hypothetical protein